VSRIYWDSMLFVYWLEDHPKYSPRVAEIHTSMAKRGDILCTSVFTVGEVLAGPYRKGAADEAAQIRTAFESPQIELVPFTFEAADRYARIRGTHRVASADAIHLASASGAGVDLFLTNDHALHPLVIPGIQFIAGLDVNLF
jgi:predicted nucleic acid-binding protein